MPADSPTRRCVPGDLLVTEVHSGYLVGRIIPRVGLGPWWTFITVVNERDAAVEQARVMALTEGVRAWLQTRPNEYDLL